MRSASSAASSALPFWRRFSPTTAATASRSTSSMACAPRSGSALASSAWARWARSRSRRGGATSAAVAPRGASPDPLDPKTAALAGSWLKQRERFAEAGVPHDAWLGDGSEVTVQAFSLGGELHALSGPSGAAALAARAAAALGIREGPTSTRIRITARGPQVIELAARVGSPEEVEVVRVATGVDLNALALKGALGEPIEPVELPARPLAA